MPAVSSDASPYPDRCAASAVSIFEVAATDSPSACGGAGGSGTPYACGRIGGYDTSLGGGGIVSDNALAPSCTVSSSTLGHIGTIPFGELQQELVSCQWWVRPSAILLKPAGASPDSHPLPVRKSISARALRGFSSGCAVLPGVSFGASPCTDKYAAPAVSILEVAATNTFSDRLLFGRGEMSLPISTSFSYQLEGCHFLYYLPLSGCSPVGFSESLALSLPIVVRLSRAVLLVCCGSTARARPVVARLACWSPALATDPAAPSGATNCPQLPVHESAALTPLRLHARAPSACSEAVNELLCSIPVACGCSSQSLLLSACACCRCLRLFCVRCLLCPFRQGLPVPVLTLPQVLALPQSPGLYSANAVSASGPGPALCIGDRLRELLVVVR